MKHLTRIGKGLSIFSVIYTIVTFAFFRHGTVGLPMITILVIPFMLYLIGYASEGLFSFNSHKNTESKESADILKKELHEMLDKAVLIEDQDEREMVRSVLTKRIVWVDNVMKRLDEELKSLTTIKDKMTSVISKLEKKEGHHS